MRHVAQKWLSLSALCLLVLAPVYGQRDMGTILGTVRDASGAVIPGATVTISEDATGLEYSVSTNESGNFIRPLLKPGSYTVAVEADGFKTTIQTGITLQSAARVQANFTLELGTVTETVEVSAVPPALQTSTSTMGGTLESRQTSELPLGGQRRFAFLARTVPGVVPGEPGARDSAGGAFSANGVRSNGQNNFLLNGVDNNVNVIDFINQTAYVVGPSVEAIGEMQVLTNGYNAEYGRAAGGVVNVTIKSGTNEIHGTLFEFLQNSAMNANLWESNRAGNPKGAFQQNQFGAAVGGPLIKNRTFWFADYQGTRIVDKGATSTLTIPTQAYAAGDFSAFLTSGVAGVDDEGRQVFNGQIFDPLTRRVGPSGKLVRDPFANNAIPVGRMDPVSRQLAAQFPAENQRVTAAGQRPGSNYFTQRIFDRQVDQYDVRIDHRISDKDNIFWSLSWSDEDKFNAPPFGNDLDAGGFAGAEEENISFNSMVSYSRVWSPSLITETRFSATRLNTRRLQANSDKNSFSELGIGGLQPITVTDRPNGGLPLFQVGGYSNFGSSEWLPTQEFSRVWDFVQNVSWNKGSHAIKVGFEYRPIGFPFFQVPAPRGRWNASNNHVNSAAAAGPTGDAFAAFLLGYSGTSSRISTANFIESQREAYSWYAQDDWKLTNKLTLNFGVRYELTSPIGEKQGRQSNFDRDSATLFIPEGPFQDLPVPPNWATDFPELNISRGQVDARLIDWDKTNIAPRAGLAYQITNGTVIRAGYGIFYGAEENEGGSPNRGEGPPFNLVVNFPNDGQFGSFELPTVLNRLSDGFPTDFTALPAPPDLRGVALRHFNPLVHKWNLNIQRDLGSGNVLEVGYIGSKGQRLKTNWGPNNPVFSPDPGAPVAPRRPLPWLNTNTSQTATFGRSNYHALTAKVEKRFSAGLQYLASYTWGHALTDVNTPLSGGPGQRDPHNLAAAYSSANFDVRQRFVLSGLWEVPIGRGRQLGSNMGRAANALIGGWQINGIWQMQTGQPFSITTNQGQCGCNGAVRPDVVAGQSPQDAPAGGRTPDLWFNVDALVAPAPGTFGNLGEMSNHRPPLRTLDLSLFKDFQFSERYRLQFRAESFNLTNTPQFNQPNAAHGTGAFGSITSTLAGTNRQFQLALRFMF